MYKSGNIYLDALHLKDSEFLFQWINSRDLVLWNNNYNTVHKPNHDEWFDAIRKKEDVRIFAIRQNNDKKLIGTCQLFAINFINRSAELQIRIGDIAEQGKGFGTEATRLLVSFGFNDLNLHRIYLHVFEHNERAIKTYDKIGFKKEGVLRDAEFIDGKYLNVVAMSILKIDLSD